MRKIASQIVALRQSLVAKGDAAAKSMTDEAAAEIVEVLSNEEFLHLPLKHQYSFLDFAHSIYAVTHHASAPNLAATVQKIFQAYLKKGPVPSARLYKTYDFLYLLYWCAATSIEQQRDFDASVVIPFSRYLSALDRHVPPAAQPSPPRQNRRLRLCYLAEFAYDGEGNALGIVADTVLASLAEHFAGKYELVLYAWKYKTPEFVKRIESLGAKVRTFDLTEYSETELSRMMRSFSEDQCDIVITDMNSAVPHQLFHHRVAPVQVFYQLGLPFWRIRNVDAVFQGWQIAPEKLGLTADLCHVVHAPKSARFIPPANWAAVRAERQCFPPSKHTIGFYGRLVKVSREQCDLIHRVLQCNPETIALLGGTGDPNPILDFIKAHKLQERMFVVNRFVDGHIWGRFLDVFLDTFPLTGGYSCREVIGKGKPVVHMLRDEMPNMNAFLDPELQASDADQYVAHTSRLLDDPAFYRRACRRALEISRQYTDTKPFASVFDSALQKVVRKTMPYKTV